MLSSKDQYTCFALPSRLIFSLLSSIPSQFISITISSKSWIKEVQEPDSASKDGIFTDGSLTRTDVFRELLKRDDWLAKFVGIVLDESDRAIIPPGCTVGRTVLRVWATEHGTLSVVMVTDGTTPTTGATPVGRNGRYTLFERDPNAPTPTPTAAAGVPECMWAPKPLPRSNLEEIAVKCVETEIGAPQTLSSWSNAKHETPLFGCGDERGDPR